jgi:hypothetical protein
LVAFDPSVAGQAVVVGTDVNKEGRVELRRTVACQSQTRKHPRLGPRVLSHFGKMALRRWRAGERRRQVDRDRQGSRSRNARVNVEVEFMERGVVGRVVRHASCQRDNVAVRQSEAMKVLRDRPNR